MYLHQLCQYIEDLQEVHFQSYMDHGPLRLYFGLKINSSGMTAA